MCYTNAGQACSFVKIMAGPVFKPESSNAPPSLKKASSSSKQTSIAGFFQKKADPPITNRSPKTYVAALPVRKSPRKASQRSTLGSDQSLTPAPSSDPAEPEGDLEVKSVVTKRRSNGNGLPSPVTPMGDNGTAKHSSDHHVLAGFYSPSRKVRYDSKTTEASLTAY